MDDIVIIDRNDHLSLFWNVDAECIDNGQDFRYRKRLNSDRGLEVMLQSVSGFFI